MYVTQQSERLRGAQRIYTHKGIDADDVQVLIYEETPWISSNSKVAIVVLSVKNGIESKYFADPMVDFLSSDRYQLLSFQQEAMDDPYDGVSPRFTCMMVFTRKN